MQYEDYLKVPLTHHTVNYRYHRNPKEAWNLHNIDIDKLCYAWYIAPYQPNRS